jgi:hypothetical protein
MSKDASGNYFQRLHALDITTGQEEFGGPRDIQATFPGTGDNSSGGNVVFDPKQYKERPGLLLLNHIVYTSWSSHCDIRPYTGWIMGYDESTLVQVSMLNITPNGSDGSNWASGAGPATDTNGNIYFLVANGTFDTTLDGNGFPIQGDYGNAFIKLSTGSSGLKVADYFNMFNTTDESSGDVDLGSGGALVLPDMTDARGMTRRLAVGAGKDTNIYLVDRDNMGKFNLTTNAIYQELPAALGGQEFGAPAYFNGSTYYGAVGDSIRAFQFSTARLSTTPSSTTNNVFGFPGATPSISAHGAGNGIVWAAENTDPAVLHAYDATDLSRELYSSNQAGGRDQFGTGNKFIAPTIVNGKVYVGTANGVGVFGLLGSPASADFSIFLAPGSSMSATVAAGKTASSLAGFAPTLAARVADQLCATWNGMDRNSARDSPGWPLLVARPASAAIPCCRSDPRDRFDNILWWRRWKQSHSRDSVGHLYADRDRRLAIRLNHADTRNKANADGELVEARPGSNSGPDIHCFREPAGKADLAPSTVRLTTKVNSLPCTRIICFWCLNRSKSSAVPAPMAAPYRTSEPSPGPPQFPE